MSTNYHSAISASSAATTAVLNAPLGQLDSAISGIIAGSTAFTQLNLGATSTLTIASGVITVTRSRHLVNTQSSAATDDLDTINGSAAGDVLALQLVNASRIVTLKHNTGNIYIPSQRDFVLSSITDIAWLLYDVTNLKWILINARSFGDPSVCEARLTLETGVPISTSDQTAKTTLYLTPFRGNRIALYDGSTGWYYKTLTSDLSSTLGGLTASLPYDVFVYLNSGNLTLELVAWTNTSTRATALTKQDGIYVKNGDTTRRYLGTICITSVSGECEDSAAKRLVWNYYNRVERPLQKLVSTDTWTYATAAWRQWNADTANQVDFVIGVTEEAVHFVLATLAAGAISSAIGLDGTTPASLMTYQSLNAVSNQYIGTPAAGSHSFKFLEYAPSGSVTVYGDGGVAYHQLGGNGIVRA